MRLTFDGSGFALFWFTQYSSQGTDFDLHQN